MYGAGTGGFLLLSMMLEGNFYLFYFSVNPEDEDLYRYKDARVTTNFDRTKYHFNHYFMSTHQMASVRRTLEARDHPDDPRVNIIFLYFR